MLRSLLSAVMSLSAVCVYAEPVGEKVLPLPGEAFVIHGHTAFLIMPEASTSKPQAWVMYAPTLAGLPGVEEVWMFQRFLDAGIAIAGIDVGESYGNPEGRNLYTAFYDELVENRGMESKARLLARSRGGLMLYNWAAENSDKVACIAGIYPVCDLRSYPGLAQAAGAYGMSASELEQQLGEHNPVERLQLLANAKVPVFHIHGDSDTVVPLEANSGTLVERYKALGGPITLEVVEGRGHDMWTGWFQSQALVDFVIAAGN